MIAAAALRPEVDAQLRPEVDAQLRPEVDAQLRPEVDAQLRGRRRVAFSRALAAIYEQRLGPGRKRHLAVALLLTAIAIAAAAILDHQNAPALFHRALPWRVGVVALCLAGALAVIRVRPGVLEGLAFGVPLIGQVILSAWVGAAAPPYLVDRNIVLSLIIFAVLCAVPPVPVGTAKLLAAVWFCTFVLSLWLTEGTALLRDNISALIVGGLALAVGVYLSVRREHARRREFLHVLSAELTASELSRMNEELERLMNTDVLTGVANRRRFESDMRNIWPTGQSITEAARTVGLLLIDVDHFKPFNDGAGHAEGDECLRAIATAIAAVVRGGAFCMARWGGEEFVVLAPGIAHADLAGLAERVRLAVTTLAIPHPAWAGTSVTVSVGAAWCGPHALCETPDDLLRCADRALYAAKEAGRDRIFVWPLVAPGGTSPGGSSALTPHHEHDTSTTVRGGARRAVDPA